MAECDGIELAIRKRFPDLDVKVQQDGGLYALVTKIVRLPYWVRLDVTNKELNTLVEQLFPYSVKRDSYLAKQYPPPKVMAIRTLKVKQPAFTSTLPISRKPRR